MDDSLRRTLLETASLARKNARVVQSGFHVGAALLTSQGNIVTGCNVELKSTLSSICAERTALVKAVSMGFTEFTAIAVVSDADHPISPCSFCRQYLIDLAPDLLVIMSDPDFREIVEVRMIDLVPMAFTGSGRDKHE